MRNKKRLYDEFDGDREDSEESFDLKYGVTSGDEYYRHRKTRGRKRGWIAFGVLTVIVAAVGVFAVKNLSLIRAMYKGLTLSADTIQQDLQQNEIDTANALQQSGITVSPEELEKAISGDMSEEEIMQMIYASMSSGGETADGDLMPDTDGDEASEPDAGNEANVGMPDETEDDGEEPRTSKTEPAQDAGQPKNTADGEKPVSQNDKTSENAGKQNTKPDGKQNAASDGKQSNKQSNKQSTKTGGKQPAANSEDAVNQRVAELVAKVYSLKAQYTGELASLEASVKAQYIALPKEQRTAAAKAQLVSANMGYASGLEAQCDAQINAVTAELASVLTAAGRDTALVDSILTAYNNEKELKKSYYISLYK